MKHHRARLAAVISIFALALLAGCSSGGVGSILGGVLGGVLGGGNQGSNYPRNQSSNIRATVDYVDTRSQRIELSYVNGQNRSATIYYDSRTRVTYGNRSSSPSDLERGDEVDIRVSESGNRAVADTIQVTRSVSDQGGYRRDDRNSYPDSRAGTIQGTVDYVDTQGRRMELTNVYVDGRRASQRTVTVYFDNQTRVLYQNQTFYPSDLERGDEVQVRLYTGRSNQYQADTITVTRNIRR